MLQIRKKGNKNFTHIATGYTKPYGANDLTLITEGDVLKLRSISGRSIFEKDGYDLANVQVFDDLNGGSAEVFATIELLRQRLINLGYPWSGGVEVVGGIESVVAGTNITVDATDPQNPIVNANSGGVQSVTGDLVDNTNPATPTVLNAYRGKYNATTNTPTLDNTDTGQIGRWYEVEVAGTQDFGDGDVVMDVGDFIYNDGSVWKIFVNNNQSGGTTPTIQEVLTEGDEINVSQNVQFNTNTVNRFYTLSSSNDQFNIRGLSFPSGIGVPSDVRAHSISIQDEKILLSVFRLSPDFSTNGTAEIEIKVDEIEITGTRDPFQGIVGTSDYSVYYSGNDLAYVQNGYVKNLIQQKATRSLTSTAITTLDLADKTTFGDSHYQVLTTNTDIQWSNTPDVGETEVRTLEVIGAFSLSFSTSTKVIGTYIDDGTTVNTITVNFANYSAAALRITVLINS